MSNEKSNENEESEQNNAKPTITIAEKSGSSQERDTITIAEKKPEKP